MRAFWLLVCVTLLVVACTNDGEFIPTDGAAQDSTIDAPVKLDSTPDALDAADVARTCETPNPANACPTAAAPCVPTGCHCFNGLWACTADCGGGRDCGDARADDAKPVCTPGMDQTCNDNPAISSLHGRCEADRTCACTTPFVVNPSTGRCR